MKNIILIGITTILAISLISCSNQKTRSNSSVVDYLYPASTNTIIKPSIPTLKLPLKVGIAFVPDAGTERKGRNWWTGV